MKTLSRKLHNRLYHDHDQSLCSRAYMYREESLFWRLFYYCMTPSHCEKSYRHYHDNEDTR